MFATSQRKAETHKFVFDDVIVDCLNFEVHKSGQLINLTPRAFDVLIFLLENSGRVVEKSQLFEHVWKERFVSDNALSRVIKEIRHAIGDHADTPRYIETVPRRGYKFIGSVHEDSLGPTQPPAPPLTFQITQEATHVGLSTLSHSVLGVFNSRLWSLIVVGLVFVIGLMFLKSWTAKSPGASSKLTVIKSAQITTWTGLDIFPTISPDGNMVTYSSDRTGKFELYSRALILGAKENQLTSDGQQNLEPSWSPDGKWIAYYSQLKGGIWIMPAGGGVPRQLVDFGSRPAWSHDGTHIAFQSDGLSDIGNISAINPTSSIWIISASGDSLQQVTHPGNPIGGHGSPAWSVDGKRIAFVASDTVSAVVWSISPEGNQLRQLTNSSQSFSDPVYTPDGKNLLIASGGIWRIALNTNGDPAGDLEQVANPTQAQVRNLSFSADGKRVVSSLLRQRTNLWSVHLNGANERLGVASTFVEDTTQRKTTPLFSPDGTKVAYNVWIAGSPGGVWTVNSNGTDSVQLTADAGGVVGWLPGNDQLMSINFRDAGPRLIATSLATGVRKTLANLPRRMPFSRLSPDGKTLAFNAYEDGAVNIWLYSIETGVLKQLSFDKELFGYPAWSPDGKWIAGELKRKDDTLVALIPADGGTPPY